MNRRNVLALVILLVVTFAAAAIGGLATSTGAWYDTINRPSWNPPSWVFGPVWTVLYICQAVAAWLVWRKDPPTAPKPLAMYSMQLVLNAAWSLIFFGAHQIGAAAIEVVVLWTAIIATIVVFARRSKAAAWLLVPYLLWVTFASALTIRIWTLN